MDHTTTHPGGQPRPHTPGDQGETTPTPTGGRGGEIPYSHLDMCNAVLVVTRPGSYSVEHCALTRGHDAAHWRESTGEWTGNGVTLSLCPLHEAAPGLIAAAVELTAAREDYDAEFLRPYRLGTRPTRDERMTMALSRRIEAEERLRAAIQRATGEPRP